MTTLTSFKDLYSFPGFRASVRLKVHPDHPGALVTTLKRRQKKLFVRAGKSSEAGTTVGLKQSAILMPEELRFIWSSKSVGLNAASVRP